MDTEGKRPYSFSPTAQTILAENEIKKPAGIDKVVSGQNFILPDGRPVSFPTLYAKDRRPQRKFALAAALMQREDYERSAKIKLLDNFITDQGQEQENDENFKMAKELQGELRLLAIEVGVIKPTEEEQRFKAFRDRALEPGSPEAEVITKLYSVFGVEAGADIFFRHMPHLRGTPIDQVKHFLSDWLGEFLEHTPPFNPQDIEIGLQYLSDTSFREGLKTVLKNSSVADYLAHKKEGTDLSDRTLIDGYLNYVRTETETFSTQDVKDIIDEVEKYYSDIFEQQGKPSHIVDELIEGRNFPDLGQGINIKEIQENKRMVIADRMGLGKSASAILSKEYLGLKTALVITPNAVVDTWEGYLSDKVDENGKQIGYFKKDQAPKVLVIRDQDSLIDQNTLENIDFSAYDYVVISQEKLNNNYTPALLSTKFDMLIVDEVHKLKNVTDGVRSNNLIDIVRNNQGENQYTVMLSGTPIPDKVSDIAVLLKLLYPERFIDMDNKELVTQIIQGDLIDLRSLLLPRLQMKDLRDMIQMPLLKPRKEYADLSEIEQDIYEALLDEDELPASAKLALLENFLINPDMLETTPGIQSTKIASVGASLKKAFVENDKVTMFVNRHIEDVIRGDKAILDKLGLPAEIEVLIIHGQTPDDERETFTQRFKQSTGKVLMVFSGNAVDVGVDYSEGKRVDHYNNPWTMSRKDQQTARVYRPGITEDVEEVTHIMRGTIEEGIQLYIEAKHKAIMKLLYGVPIKDEEQQILQADIENTSVNSDLAEYHFSTWDRTNRMFAYGKGIGETEFMKFLKRNGIDYADGYRVRGRRSYEANASRVTGALINVLEKERVINTMDNSRDTSMLRILDIGSGPEMLRKHIAPEYQDSIISLDMNEHHFDKSQKTPKVLGSFNQLPIASDSIDYASFNLALHYSKLVPTKEIFETIEALSEVSRVLKIGGKLIINEIYSWNFKNQENFRKLADSLGFKVIDEYSGAAKSENSYQSNVVVLEKINEATPQLSNRLGNELTEEESRSYYTEELIKFISNLDNEQIESAKKLPDAQTPSVKLRDTRKVVGYFTLNGATFPIVFNPEDQQVRSEEELAEKKARELESKYGKIELIPRDEIISNNFVRFYNGHKWVLFRKLSQDNGAIVIR